MNAASAEKLPPISLSGQSLEVLQLEKKSNSEREGNSDLPSFGKSFQKTNAVDLLQAPRSSGTGYLSKLNLMRPLSQKNFQIHKLSQTGRCLSAWGVDWAT